MWRVVRRSDSECRSSVIGRRGYNNWTAAQLARGEGRPRPCAGHGSSRIVVAARAGGNFRHTRRCAKTCISSGMGRVCDVMAAREERQVMDSYACRNIDLVI